MCLGSYKDIIIVIIRMLPRVYTNRLALSLWEKGFSVWSGLNLCSLLDFSRIPLLFGSSCVRLSHTSYLSIFPDPTWSTCGFSDVVVLIRFISSFLLACCAVKAPLRISLTKRKLQFWVFFPSDKDNPHIIRNVGTCIVFCKGRTRFCF